jgi:hypothetical protein
MLRRSAATVGAGTLLGIAGCSSLNPFGGGGAYANWLPVPDDIDAGDHYQFTYLDTENLEGNEDELPDDFDLSFFESTWSPADIDWEDTSTILSFDSVIVADAEFTREDVVSDLEDEDFDEDTDHQGYTLYLGPNELQAFALNDSNLLVAFGVIQSDPIDLLEAAIDANNGEAERYGEDNDDLSTLVGELGGGSVVTGRTTEEPDNDDPEAGRFDHMVARGNESAIDGDTADRRWVVVYDSADDVDTDDLEDWVDANDGSDEMFDDVDDISYNQNGRLGIVSGTSDTDDL